MFRRSFLAALPTLSALPVIPDRLNPGHPPTIPSEGNFMFWFHFHSAIQRERVMSTKEARERVVADLDLDDLTDNEAIRFLRLANEDVYDTDDMPKRWYGVFDEMETNLYA
jgi:hypothetical protein